MPEAITWGHALILAGLVAAAVAATAATTWSRSREFGRGTPQYAHGRDARRRLLYATPLALALLLAGLLTPLAELPIAG